jgi:hypothetical protein
MRVGPGSGCTCGVCWFGVAKIECHVLSPVASTDHMGTPHKSPTRLSYYAVQSICSVTAPLMLVMVIVPR